MLYHTYYNALPIHLWHIKGNSRIMQQVVF